MRIDAAEPRESPIPYFYSEQERCGYGKRCSKIDRTDLREAQFELNIEVEARGENSPYLSGHPFLVSADGTEGKANRR